VKKLLGRLWIEWKIAISFLREGRMQSLMITVGVAVGVSVIVFISALIQGLQSNIIDRTLGTQAHIRLLSPDEVNQVIPSTRRHCAAGSRR
jgi:ABC-type transport system, involved in lipoprotein release, permease component